MTSRGNVRRDESLGGSMKPNGINPDARNLEDEFFAREHAKLLEGLRRKKEREERREALRQVVRIKDEAFLDHLLALGVGPETVLALRLIPLVVVAWADGKMDDAERKAVLRAAEERGVAAESTTRQLLEGWLARKPEPRLLELWKQYVGSIWSSFSDDEQWEMRRYLLDAAQEVAEAAGGFLGLTAKISKEEQAVLDDLKQTLA
jgi:tellurite resistance protein